MKVDIFSEFPPLNIHRNCLIANTASGGCRRGLHSARLMMQLGSRIIKVR
jgi:hypothetical protein